MRLTVPPALFEHATAAAAAAVLVLSTAGLSQPAHAAELRAGAVFQDRVERVVDGDTLILSDLGRVRMIGMNTPETVAPAQRQGAPPQCFGPEASAATKAMLPAGTAVRLETDVEPQDRYGRALVYVYREPDDSFINGKLVEEGFARAKSYGKNIRYEGLLASLQQDAKAGRKGLWSACAPQSKESPAPVAQARAQADKSLTNPGDSKNCADFASYAEAKSWYDKYFPLYGDVAKLDGNGDGVPCEALRRKS